MVGVFVIPSDTGWNDNSNELYFFLGLVFHDAPLPYIHNLTIIIGYAEKNYLYSSCLLVVKLSRVDSLISMD